MSEQVMISRELLEQIAAEWEHDNDKYMLAKEIRSALSASAHPAGEVPEVVAYLCNGGTKLMHASDRKEAVWNAGRPLMEVAQHTRIVAELQARAVVLPERRGLAYTDWRQWSEQDIGFNKALDEYARLNGKGGV